MNEYSALLSEKGLAIFLFHGVIRQQRWEIRNYTKKHILQERFAVILRDLHKHGVAVSMPEVVVASMGGQPLPPHAFAITFDDGFENNHTLAAPLLNDYRIPATFYITTGFIEANGSSWTDIIEHAVENTGAFRLRLPSFPDLDGSYVTREQKIQLLNQIRRLVKNDPTIDPYEFALGVQRQLGMDTVEPDPELDQKMSWEQLKALSRNGLFTIGGHGHTHRILAYLELMELEREVSTSLEKLRGNLGPPVVHYSYPEGMTHCFSEQVINVLRQNGIVCSLSAEHGINYVVDDLFHLKRFMVV